MEQINFAVVREDPLIEETIIRRDHKKNVLMIASGGCLALSLKSMLPDTKFTLFDLNPAQIDLVKQKSDALENFNSSSYPLFNIGIDDKNGLNGCGQFESLFRSFRFFINEFVLDKNTIEKIFLEEENQAKKIIDHLVRNKYWPVAFNLYFSNSMLVAMFGEDAVQHAEPNSYPTYFKNALETGFKRSDFQRNYFLQHIVLGYYVNEESSWPQYLSHPGIQTDDFAYINDNLLNISIDNYDLICLSNIFDWMNEENVGHYLNYIKLNTKKGTTLLFRQLNNNKDYDLMNNGFLPDTTLENELIKKDRSLFYNRINILTKK